MAFKIIFDKLTPIFGKMLPSFDIKSVRNCSQVTSTSTHCQNFSARTEHQLNIQIGQELHASHSYLAMANFFAQTEIALNGSSGFFLSSSNEERTHALNLINYQNMRGGRVLMYPIMKPKDNFDCLMNASEHAILLERQNTKALMDVIKVAESEDDIVTVDFITSKFLTEQMESLKTLGTTRFGRIYDGLGITETFSKILN